MRCFRDEVRASEGVAKGGDTGKGPRHTMVDETGVPIGAPPGALDSFTL